jgi:carboxyl-terminal processing protease
MSEYPLNLQAYMTFSEELEEEQEKYRNIFDKIVNQGVDNLEVDLPSIHQDESKEARNKDFIESVSKDLYIKETLHILHDMIALK